MKTTLAALLGATMLCGPVLAAGSDDDATPEPTETTMKCEEGQIWDEKTEACIAPQENSLNDDIRYDAAREMAYAGMLEEALRVLDAADNPSDARMLTYRGFVHRKMGDMDRAMGFYRAALKADPDFVLARSYMGQGLVDMGRVAAAEVQLVAIANRVGTEAWPYRALEGALAGENTDY